MSILPSKEIAQKADVFILRNMKTGQPESRAVLCAAEPESRDMFVYRLVLGVLSLIAKVRKPHTKMYGAKIKEVDINRPIPEKNALMVKTPVGNYRLVERSEVSSYPEGTTFYATYKD